MLGAVCEQIEAAGRLGNAQVCVTLAEQLHEAYGEAAPHIKNHTASLPAD